ncbi:MAG: DUF5989 family protein [bacterium]
MRAIRYVGRLIVEFLGFAWQNKAWLIIPVVLVLLLLGIIVVAGAGGVQFIYTAF